LAGDFVKCAEVCVKVIDYVVHEHEFLIEFEICEFTVNCVRLERVAEDVSIRKVMKLSHNFAPVRADVFHVHCGSPASLSPLFVKGSQVKYVTIERCFDEFRDSFFVHKLIHEPITLRI
jgi:hypothetical protein